MTFEKWLVSHARVSVKTRKNVTLDDKMTFFHQLATLVTAGTPLLNSIQISAEQSESLTLRRVLNEVAGRLTAGTSLHAAAADYPKIFEHAWVEVIRTGEITGKMSHVLLELNKQVHESRETRRKLKGAMTYPIVLLCVASLAITAMLWFVVPTFTKMFAEMGTKLPEITQLVVSASAFVVHYGLYVAGAIALLVVSIRRYGQTDEGRRNIIGVLIVTPIIGDLIVQITMYKFASNLALLLNSGVPIIETLDTLQGIFGHSPIYRDALARVQGRVSAGQTLGNALDETGLFTTMLVNMVRIGEESGQLATVMEQIAPYYKDKVEGMIARTSKMMEPIIIVGMGAAVAVMMLSIYMPMFEMSGNIK